MEIVFNQPLDDMDLKFLDHFFSGMTLEQVKEWLHYSDGPHTDYIDYYI